MKNVRSSQPSEATNLVFQWIFVLNQDLPCEYRWTIICIIECILVYKRQLFILSFFSRILSCIEKIKNYFKNYSLRLRINIVFYYLSYIIFVNNYVLMILTEKKITDLDFKTDLQFKNKYSRSLLKSSDQLYKNALPLL